MAVTSFSSSFKLYAKFVISLALVALFCCTFLFSKFFQYKIWLFFRAKSLLCFLYSKRKIFCFLFIKYWQVWNTENLFCMGSAIFVQNPMSRVLTRFPTTPTLSLDMLFDSKINLFRKIIHSLIHCLLTASRSDLTVLLVECLCYADAFG